MCRLTSIDLNKRRKNWRPNTCIIQHIMFKLNHLLRMFCIMHEKCQCDWITDTFKTELREVRGGGVMASNIHAWSFLMYTGAPSLYVTGVPSLYVAQLLFYKLSENRLLHNITCSLSHDSIYLLYG